MVDEPDARAAWAEQVQVYAAHGPSDHTERPSYYVAVVAALVGLVLAVLVVAQVGPQGDPPPTTTLPPLTFVTLPPGPAAG